MFASLKKLFNRLSGTEPTPAPAAAPVEPAAPVDSYYVRFSTAEDFDRILAFYDMNAHKNVRKRQMDLMRELADNGAIILIEDEKGTLVASSITYAHKTKDADGLWHAKWQEIGTTRIVLNGFPGLFDAMVTMQVLRTFMVEPPEDKFVARMHTVPVQNMAKKLGWMPYTAPAELIAIQKQSVDPNDQSTADPTVNWFFCGTEALPVMARHMVKTLDNPTLKHAKTGREIRLDFSRSSFFKLMSPEIRNLAQRDLGDPAAPDLSKSTAASRDKWMRKFFR